MKTTFTIILLIIFTINCLSQTSLKLHYSVCETSDSSLFFKERIVKKQLIGDTLTIILGKKDPCCVSYKAEYKIENDTLKISFISIGDECFCNCYYYLTFKVPNMKNDSIPVLFNNKAFELTDQVLINFSDKVDTLDNGNILITKYQDNIKTWEIEKTPIERIYRQFKNGVMIWEKTVRTKDE